MIQRILFTVADHYATTPDELRARFAHQHLAEARHVYCYIARYISNESLSTIAAEINRTKPCMVHSTKWVIDKMLIYPAFRIKVTSIANAAR